MNNKKGISAVVATVLIILITVAAVTIIWAAIIPMVKDNLDKGTVCLNALQQLSILNRGYTCYDSGANEVRVQVARGPGDIELTGIQIIVSDDAGTSDSYEETTLANLPDPNGERVLTFSGAPANSETVKIAPIITVGGADETCDATSAVTLRDC